MYYIVGLGNPGEEYRNTRHNVGWILLDKFIAETGLPTPVASSKYAGRISEGVVDGVEVRILYPETFMNKSGRAVKKLVSASETSRLIVLYDDVDLPLGEIKISVGKGDGGHNGIKSIIESLGSKDFVRVRIGISPKSFWTGKIKRPAGDRLGQYVLKNFTGREELVVDEVAECVSGALRHLLTRGYESAMNQFNS